jgi:phytanoyl-CoA hydroxylase
MTVTVLPWFDQPSAEKNLPRLAKFLDFEERDRKLISKWIRDGYFIVDDLLTPSELDQLKGDIDAIWKGPRSFGANPQSAGDFQMHLRLRASGDVTNFTFAEWVALSAAKRAGFYESHLWRIHGLQNISPVARKIRRAKSVLSLASKVFAAPAHPLASIAFGYGSQQLLHQDMAVFHILPKNFLLGVWIALEDVSPDAGPLVYLPGSHRVEPFRGFTNYPWTNLRTVSPAITEEYQAYVDHLAQGFKRVPFHAKKGQTLFWHGMLLHGGDPIRDPRLTRGSFVLHYTTSGANRSAEVKGPFNW